MATQEDQVQELEVATPLVTGQQVTITGTLVDSTNKAWNSAVVIIQLVPGFGVPLSRYTWNGADFVKRQQLTTTGNTFSIALPSNDTILPIDSAWSFTISGNPTSPAAVFTKVLNYSNGATQDISALFTSVAPPLVPQSGGGGGDPALTTAVTNILSGDLTCS